MAPSATLAGEAHHFPRVCFPLYCWQPGGFLTPPLRGAAPAVGSVPSPARSVWNTTTPPLVSSAHPWGGKGAGAPPAGSQGSFPTSARLQTDLKHRLPAAAPPAAPSDLQVELQQVRLQPRQHLQRRAFQCRPNFQTRSGRKVGGGGGE